MKRILIITAALALFLTGCNNDPVAYFEYTPVNPAAGDQIFFTNLSEDAESFEWTFSGPSGTTITSAYNPVHTFTSGGSHTVQLKAFSKRGAMDVTSATLDVIAVEPSAGFYVYTDVPTDDGTMSLETDIVFVGEQVEFDNTTLDGDTYFWDFGDGYTAEAISPVYSYDSPGIYDVTLTAYGLGGLEDEVVRTIEVVEGINSVLRITVLEYYDEYPVANASVILYGSVEDWQNETDPSQEVFTSDLGKCVYEGMDYQRYYVDVWEANHDNYLLAEESVDFIETQPLEPGYIHDFIAYVDYYESEKKMTLTRLGRKELAKTTVSEKKASEMRTPKTNKFSKTR